MESWAILSSGGELLVPLSGEGGGGREEGEDWREEGGGGRLEGMGGGGKELIEVGGG